MTQVTLLKDGVSVEDRVYSKGEVVTVPDRRAAEMVKAGEADYAVERNPDASQVSPSNATHPVTDQGFPIDHDGKAHPEAVIGTGQTGTLDTSKIAPPVKK